MIGSGTDLWTLLETRLVEICLEVFVVALVVVHLEVERLRAVVLVFIVVRLKRLRIEGALLRVVRRRMRDWRRRVKVRLHDVAVVAVEAVETGLLVLSDVPLELFVVLELRNEVRIAVIVLAPALAVVLVPASPVLNVEVVGLWNVGPGFTIFTKLCTFFNYGFELV